MSERDSEAATPDALLAANIRRIRTDLGWRQADLAEHMHPYAGWNSSTVAWVENGRRAISGAEVYWLCVVLGVGADELMKGSRRVVRSDGLAIASVWVRRAAMAQGFPARRTSPEDATARDDERKAAARLGVTPEVFRVLIYMTFGRHLDQERNRRIGDVTGLSPRTIQAKRGHATRAIVAELSALIDEHGIEAVLNRRTR